MQWQVLIPVRPAGTGKSRLRGATVDAARHAEVVRAIQADAVSALVSARDRAGPGPAAIAGIHLISAAGVLELPPGVELLVDDGSGLNAAIDSGARAVARAHPGHALLAVVGDLPSLRADEVLAVLSAAGAFPRAFVADASGHGTTMLAVHPGGRLDPRFGPDSARSHRESGAQELPAGPGARTDVDTAADLRRCLELGVGSHTAGVITLLNPFI